MISGLLSKAECASCKFCCIFDKYDLWETPVINSELRDTIIDILPETAFVKRGESYLLRMNADDNGIYHCPMLRSDIGCLLSDKKPFDCRIWPFRVMRLEGYLAITVSNVCKTVYNKPLSEVMSELDRNNLADRIFDEAFKNPDIIKNYENGYPILRIKKYDDGMM